MLQLIIFNAFFSLSAIVASAQLPTEYAYGDNPRHKVDVYLPQDANNAPVIVMLHGGAWQSGDKRGRNIWYAKVAHWVPNGAIFISVNTRLRPEAHPYEQTQDLAKAMRFVQDNIETWGGDPNQIFLMGHSSGAHVAMLLSTRQDMQNAAGLAPWAGTIALDTAALDVAYIMENEPVPYRNKAFGVGSEYWVQTSPIDHLDSKDGPFFVVCSKRHGISCEIANRFADRSTREGVNTKVLAVDFTHGEVNDFLGSDHTYTAHVDTWINANKH